MLEYQVLMDTNKFMVRNNTIDSSKIRSRQHTNLFLQLIIGFYLIKLLIQQLLILQE